MKKTILLGTILCSALSYGQSNYIDRLKKAYGNKPTAKEFFNKVDKFRVPYSNFILNPSCNDQETFNELQKALKSLGLPQMNGVHNLQYRITGSDDGTLSVCRIESVYNNGYIASRLYQVMKNKKGETLVIPIVESLL